MNLNQILIKAKEDLERLRIAYVPAKRVAEKELIYAQFVTAQNIAVEIRSILLEISKREPTKREYWLERRSKWEDEIIILRKAMSYNTQHYDPKLYPLTFTEVQYRDLHIKSPLDLRIEAYQKNRVGVESNPTYFKVRDLQKEARGIRSMVWAIRNKGLNKDYWTGRYSEWANEVERLQEIIMQYPGDHRVAKVKPKNKYPW